jgi:hypothetical protein
MADGSRVPIENVMAGDVVRSFDPESGTVTSARVLQTLRHEAGSYPDALVNLNGRLLVTGNHPLFANGGPVRADAISLGATIVAIDGDGTSRVDIVRSIASLPAGVPVFDLRVGWPGTFVAAGVVFEIKP